MQIAGGAHGSIGPRTLCGLWHDPDDLESPIAVVNVSENLSQVVEHND